MVMNIMVAGRAPPPMPVGAPKLVWNGASFDMRNSGLRCPLKDRQTSYPSTGLIIYERAPSLATPDKALIFRKILA
jgi:hypothetical protein